MIYNGRKIDFYNKNQVLMKKIFLFFVSGMLLISCHTSKTPSSNPVVTKNSSSDLNGTWQLQMLFASDNNWAKTPYININSADKTFSGNSGCNSIRGKFIMNDSYLGFDKDILSTKMACTDPNSNRNERTFLSALLKINKYSVSKDELELGQGEIVLMKFKRTYN